MRRHIITDDEAGSISIQMRVIILASATTDHKDGFTAQRTLTDSRHIAVRRRIDGGTTLGEDILPLRADARLSGAHSRSPSPAWPVRLRRASPTPYPAPEKGVIAITGFDVLRS
ncbi:MAG: hypothetical protein WKF84_06165 [Pyrinomonadaceae bacterium]